LELQGHLYTVLELESRRIHSATRLVCQESLVCCVTNGSGGVDCSFGTRRRQSGDWFILKEVDTLNLIFLGDAGGSCKILDLTFVLVIG